MVDELAPGWYRADPGTERYWNGQWWGETRVAADATPQDFDRISPGGLALSVLIPILGLVYAVVKFANGQLRAGTSAAAISLIMMLIGTIAVLALS